MSAADDRLARQAARAASAEDNPLAGAFLAGMAAANLDAEAQTPVIEALRVPGPRWLCTCPFCGERHDHGGPGQREAHCGRGRYRLRDVTPHGERAQELAAAMLCRVPPEVPE